MLTDDDMAAIDQGRGPYVAAVERIRNDPHLTVEGKRGALGRLVGTERRRRQSIVQTRRDTTQARRAKLDQALFSGPKDPDPSTTISWRDALDRAEAARTPGELGQLINRAMRSNDDLLLKAAMARSYGEYNTARHRDPKLAQAWEAAASPAIEALPADTRATLTELSTLDAALTDPDNAMKASMASTVPAPPEISHLMDHQIDAMADSDTEEQT